MHYKKSLLALASLMACLASTGQAAEYYWDTNGTSPGFGVGGTWGTDSFWTTATNGTTATGAWPGLARPSTPDSARFTSGSGTITLSGTQTASLARVSGGGTYTLSGGTLNLETANFNTGLNTSAFDGDNGNSITVDSAVTLGADGGTGTREIVFSVGRNTGTAGTNTMTLNGSISAGSGARATGQLIQLRPQTATALGSSTITQSATSVISNGSQTISLEAGTRAADANSGRVELRGANTYTGSTRIGSGTIVVYTDVANSSAGAFGNNTNAIDIGFGQLISTSHARLLTNGARTISKAINIGNGASSISTYAVTIGGETADVSSFGGNIDLDGATARTTAVSLTAASGGRVNFTGILSHGTSGSSVPIEKIGLGTVNLAGNNTYAGGTTVSAGTLLVNNTLGSGTGTGAVSVSSGAALGGNGTISGGVSFSAGSNFVFSLTDTLDVNGASVSFGGFSITNLLGLTGSVSDGTYTLIGGSASISSTNLSNLGAMNAYDLGGGKNAYFDLGTGDLQVVVSAIPEPSAFAVFAGLGAIGLAAIRRRRAS